MGATMQGKHNSISRRAFVGTSAVAALALASGCSPENRLGETTDKKVYRLDAELDESVDGKWKFGSCYLGCGGRCVNYAYVVDGIIVRQKTDDSHEDSPDYPQQRACVRGHSQRQRVFGADRLKYPMKRSHWEPGGGDKSLRGRDTWERISWEEALDYVANELKTTKEKFGNRAILFPSWSNYIDMSGIGNLLAAFGGFTEVADSASFGSFGFDVGVIGLPAMAAGTSRDRISMQKSDWIVLYGCNPAWASSGNPSYNLLQAKNKGVNFVFVGPEYNVTASMLEAKWIRLRPGTDSAFLLSVAYEMIAASNSNPNFIDYDFLNKYTVGFDSEHMPSDATLQENFKDYVLGSYDGIPKTAEWASEITGTPAEDIRWYANLMEKNNKVSLLHSFAAARCNNSEDFPQLFYTIGAMGGHFSGEGNACGECYNPQASNNGKPLVSRGTSGRPVISNVENADCFKGPELWQGILDGKYNYTGNYLMGLPVGGDKPSEIREIDIRTIYHTACTFLQTQIGIPKGIEAHRKVDFVVAQHSFLNTNAKYADIVLPITTMWERVDESNSFATNREATMFPSQVVEPMYEAKDDTWIVEELAKRLGIDPLTLIPHSGIQSQFNAIADSQLFKPDGTSSPLVTITQENLAEWGVEGTPQEGVISLAELMEKGVYQVPRKDGDGYEYNGWDAFVSDPIANKLPSKSGLFEIYCEEKANIINSMNRSIVKPYPTYIKPLNGYEDSFADWEGRVKGEYPYQIINPHYLRRSHSTFDNLPWVRRAMANPIWINADDAKEKEIQEGDTVLVFNQYGKVLRQATLTERLMPGVVSLPHGSWVDMDEETGIDKGGADNVLCAPVSSGIGLSGYNTNLVNFEKYDGPALAPDYTWPQRIVEI
jgi:anaerobic dimethyl sulfoxide reductase subunit A